MLLLPLLLSLAVGQDSPLDELEHLRKMSFTPPQLSDEEVGREPLLVIEVEILPILGGMTKRIFCNLASPT